MCGWIAHLTQVSWKQENHNLKPANQPSLKALRTPKNRPCQPPCGSRRPQQFGLDFLNLNSGIGLGFNKLLRFMV